MGKMKHRPVLCFLLFTVLVFCSEGQTRCFLILNQNRCNLSECKHQCLFQANGNGLCEANVKGYRCTCFYNCLMTNKNDKSGNRI